MLLSFVTICVVVDPGSHMCHGLVERSNSMYEKTFFEPLILTELLLLLVSCFCLSCGIDKDVENKIKRQDILEKEQRLLFACCRLQSLQPLLFI